MGTTDPKRFVRRDYEDLNVSDKENDNYNDNEHYNENVNVSIDGNGTDIEITNSDDEFEDEIVLSSTSTDVLFGNNSGNKQKEHNRVDRRFLFPLVALALALMTLLVSWYLRGSPTGFLIPNTTTTATTTATNADETENESPPQPFTANSPFFEHVLEWREVPLADVLSDYESDYESDSGAANASNHYKASIEFCSDPDKGLYGYGPVGNCVPGRAAPLIRMTPKRFYHLTLYNNAHIDTNLHTHGLHVSGVGTVDDVTRVAKPGECLTYDHYILDDADVGTFWYHPHVHPLSTQSAYGGAYGILIVDETTAVVGNQRFYPKHLSNFLTENEILLQFSSMYDEKLPNPVRSNKVNGQDSLDLFLSPDAYYYFRVSSVVYAESVNYLEFDPPDACDVRVIAYDGVYRSEVPGPSSLHKHMMTVSSRGDFSVVCTKDADVHFHQGEPSDESKMVTIRLEKESLRSSFNGPTSVFLPATLPSSPYWDPNAETIWKPRRPYYMHDLSGPTNLVDQFWSVSMDDYFVNGTKGHSLNQHVWDPNKSIRTFDLGQLLEYPILLSQKHPYHTHINRMQIVEPGGCGGRFEEGEYFDTISQSTDTCLVRTKFFDFAGRVVIHCHRFEHEDHGMMSWIDVLSGDGHQTKVGSAPAPATSCDAVL